MWAALISLVNEGRALSGLGSLENSQAAQMIYNLPHSAFHDITTGSNLNGSAGPGYDVVTGLGTPIPSVLIPDMLSHLAFYLQPGTSTAGQPINPFVVVFVENGDDQLLSSFQFGITLSLVAGPGTLGGAVNAETIGGIATFTNLIINQVGNGYQLGAKFTGGPVDVTSNTFDVVASTVSFDLTNSAIIDAQDASTANPTPDMTIVYGSPFDDSQPVQSATANTQVNSDKQALSDSIIIATQHRLENAFRVMIAGTESEIGNLQTPNLVPVKLAPNHPQFATGTISAAAQPAKGMVFVDDLLIAAVSTAAFKAVVSTSDQRKKRKAQ
jgi:hypothetical protein